jgi:hypothetical protein
MFYVRKNDIRTIRIKMRPDEIYLKSQKTIYKYLKVYLEFTSDIDVLLEYFNNVK